MPSFLDTVDRRVRANSRTSLWQVFKSIASASIAAGVVWLVMPDAIPIFAVIAAIIVVQPSLDQSFVRAFERSLGTVLGVVLAVAAAMIFGQKFWLILVVVAAAMLLSWALKLTTGSSIQVAISSVLVVAMGGGSVSYALDRIIETAIGAAVALIVNVLIVPPTRVEPANRAVLNVAEKTAEAYERIAETLRTAQTREQMHQLLVECRKLRDVKAQAETEIQKAHQSLTMNPRSRVFKEELAEDTRLLQHYQPLINRALAMVRGLRDNYSPDLVRVPVVADIARELDRAAHDLRMAAKLKARRVATQSGEEPPVITAEVPALTAPLVVLKPDPDHWVQIGSMLEDVRRMREEIMLIVDDVEHVA